MSEAVQEKSAGQSRVAAFDAYRGIAICFVVYGHTSAYGWQFQHDPANQFDFWWCVVMRNVLLPCLPIFLFLSGYLLGNARCDTWPAYKDYLSRRVSRVALPYLFWSVVFIALSSVRAGGLDPVDALLKILTGRADGPFYFILIMIQFYLLTPVFIRIMDWRYGIHAIFGVHMAYVFALYYYQFWHWPTMPFEVAKTPFIAWLSIFPLGIYVRRNPQVVEALRLHYLVPVALAFLALSIAETAWLLPKGTFELAISDIRYMPLAYGMTVILILLKLTHWPWPAALVQLGAMSFGIFFIHGFLLRRVGEVLTIASPGIQELLPLFQIAVTLIVMALCIAIISVTKRILPESVTSRLLAF